MHYIVQSATQNTPDVGVSQCPNHDYPLPIIIMRKGRDAMKWSASACVIQNLEVCLVKSDQVNDLELFCNVQLLVAPAGC